ncbi:hypothetical protein CL630_02135 [bacterium]|nr:hypothetical protein [bacterium]|tara:strand:+ start:25669 stop:26337 length:669 start_codon:yes stop_codon:yes gene_type:complete
MGHGKLGKQKRKGWQIKDLKRGFEKFYEIHGHYPASHEIDTFEHLPSSRSIQRKFGGLVRIREELGLSTSFDLRAGEHSSKRAKEINARAHKIEKEIHDYLVGIFGIEFVHREHFFTDDRRTRTDFFVYCENGNFSVDVFFPKNKRNLTGCLNSKMRTYKNISMLQYPVIFLQMNSEMSDEEVCETLARKKNKLHKYQRVMNLGEFKEFCEERNSQHATLNQ